MFFAGWTITSLFSRIGDVYGRKWPFVVFYTMTFIAYAGIMVATNLYLTIGLFFLLGLSIGKSMIAYVYLLEFTPLEYKTIVGTCCMSIDASVLLFGTVYFRFISKDWFMFPFVGLCLTLFTLILSFFLPESPQFYYSKNKFQDFKR